MLKDLFIYAATAIIASVATIVVFGHEPSGPNPHVVGAAYELPAEHLIYSSQMSPETLVFSDELFSN